MIPATIINTGIANIIVNIILFSVSVAVYVTVSGITLFIGTYSYNNTPNNKIIANVNNNKIITKVRIFSIIRN